LTSGPNATRDQNSNRPELSTQYEAET